eukprot:182439_1
MSARFPSRYELKIAGCSLICAQFLLVLLGIIYAIIDPQDYDASIYSARTDEDVVKLHEVLSSEDIRTSTEISAAIWWMSFPFYLIALYVIKKLFMSFFIGTKVEMWIYVMEKSYLFAILMTNIVGPALSLTIVSFEWSIHEYTPDTEDYVPTGYYIQLYSLVLTEEIYDAVCIADGVFLFLLCLIPQFRYFTRDSKFNVLKKASCMRKCRHFMMVLMALSVAISYSISLFRFADSGFFALNGGASAIPIYGFILKFLVGIKLWHVGNAEARYAELQRVFGDKAALKDDAGGSGDDVGAHGTYNMETIDKDENE